MKAEAIDKLEKFDMIIGGSEMITVLDVRPDVVTLKAVKDRIVYNVLKQTLKLDWYQPLDK